MEQVLGRADQHDREAERERDSYLDMAPASASNTRICRSLRNGNADIARA